MDKQEKYSFWMGVGFTTFILACAAHGTSGIEPFGIFDFICGGLLVVSMFKTMG